MHQLSRPGLVSIVALYWPLNIFVGNANFRTTALFSSFGGNGKIKINLSVKIYIFGFTVIPIITYSKELPVSEAFFPGPQHQVPFSYFIRE